MHDPAARTGASGRAPRRAPSRSGLLGRGRRPSARNSFSTPARGSHRRRSQTRHRRGGPRGTRCAARGCLQPRSIVCSAGRPMNSPTSSTLDAPAQHALPLPSTSTSNVKAEPLGDFLEQLLEQLGGLELSSSPRSSSSASTSLAHRRLPERFFFLCAAARGGGPRRPVLPLRPRAARARPVARCPAQTAPPPPGRRRR